MTQENKKPAADKFEPKITAFVCNWCTYAGADLAGTTRLKYAGNVRVIKLPCTGRIDFMFLVRAFEQGADGIMVSGCHPGDCHYNEGNYYARRRWRVFRDLLNILGIERDRVTFSWVSAAEGDRWGKVIDEFVQQITDLGPSPLSNHKPKAKK